MNFNEMVPIIEEVKRERARQDKEWGGPDHDDTHDAIEWLDIITAHTRRARAMGASPDLQRSYRYQIIRVIALGFAAMESWHRVNAHLLSSKTNIDGTARTVAEDIEPTLDDYDTKYRGIWKSSYYVELLRRAERLLVHFYAKAVNVDGVARARYHEWCEDFEMWNDDTPKKLTTEEEAILSNMVVDSVQAGRPKTGVIAEMQTTELMDTADMLITAAKETITDKLWKHVEAKWRADYHDWNE